MAIRKTYIPYGAVGELAKIGGEAQQAVREQQYAFTASQQAKQINASLQAQRERVGAEMEMQDQRLEQQKAQFDQNLELQTAQVSAQESATHYNYLNNQRQMEQQAEQFEQGMAAKERSFQLEAAMRDRQLQIAEQTSDLAVDRFLSDQELRQTNMQLWQSLEGTIDPDIYTNGVLAVQAGKLPQLPDPQQARLMTENQKQVLELRRKQMYVNQKTKEQKREAETLDKASREMFGSIASRLLPDSFGPHLGSAEQKRDQVTPAYSQYANAINYGALSEAQKTEADAIFETIAQEQNMDTRYSQADMESIRNSHWRYVPVAQRAESYLQAGQPQTTPPASTQTQVSYEPPRGEGRDIKDYNTVVNGKEENPIVTQFMIAAKQNGSVAREMAREAGWTGF